MSRIVRSSKYRHVFGTVAKKENCYDELKVSRNAWDGNFIHAGATFFAVCFESAGGGSFAVIPHTKTGKLEASYPLVNGHKNPVLDIEFNPFNDNLIVSGSEDCYAKVWKIPEGGLTETLTEAVQTLSGHKRKVGQIRHHPTASNVVGTAGSDLAIKIWDIEAGKDTISLDTQHPELIQCFDWSHNGSTLATACKDKKLRFFDPRSLGTISEVEAHTGIKSFRVCFLGKKEKIFTCGFTKTSEREYCVWDPRALATPLNRTNLDNGSGVLMPFYDNDTNVLYLAGKGDGNIRYFEIVDEAPYIYYLTEFKSNTPQRGACTLPKRSVSVSDCEILRMLKLGPKTVEPISFQVPRKSDVFHDDIFPDCFNGDPTISASDYFGGKNGEPKTASMANGFIKKSPTDFNPSVKIDDSKPAMSEHEMRNEIEKLQKRVNYLETELVKKDGKIKELEGK